MNHEMNEIERSRMNNVPSTPAELKTAFLSILTPKQLSDPLILAAVDHLITRIEDAYCGLVELTSIEQLFGRSLLELWEQENL